MTTYICTIDSGEGGTTTIQAGSLVAAVVKAREWVAGGDWRIDGTVILRVNGGGQSHQEDVSVERSGVFVE